jgi:hypothetical protein
MYDLALVLRWLPTYRRSTPKRVDNQHCYGQAFDNIWYTDYRNQLANKPRIGGWSECDIALDKPKFQIILLLPELLAANTLIPIAKSYEQYLIVVKVTSLIAMLLKPNNFTTT